MYITEGLGQEGKELSDWAKKQLDFLLRKTVQKDGKVLINQEIFNDIARIILIDSDIFRKAVILLRKMLKRSTATLEFIKRAEREKRYIPPLLKQLEEERKKDILELSRKLIDLTTKLLKQAEKIIKEQEFKKDVIYKARWYDFPPTDAIYYDKKILDMAYKRAKSKTLETSSGLGAVGAVIAIIMALKPIIYAITIMAVTYGIIIIVKTTMDREKKRIEAVNKLWKDCMDKTKDKKHCEELIEAFGKAVTPPPTFIEKYFTYFLIGVGGIILLPHIVEIFKKKE